MNIFKSESTLTSSKIARARTELTVASDRMDGTASELQQMRHEILESLSRYMNLESDVFSVRLEIIHKRNRGVQDVKTIQIK